MANKEYGCPDCGLIPMLWDATGAINGTNFACWYCTECGNIIPPSTKYPAP